MKRFLIMVGMITAGLAPAALADAVRDAIRPCLIERLPRAKAACIGVVADTRLARLEARLESATADLQGGTAQELIAYRRDLAASQALWRDRVQSECQTYAGGDKVAFQTCRLDQVIARDAAVQSSLNEARAQMGMAPLIDVPDEIEVLIPLPAAPGGPESDLRVPLTIPIRP